MQVTKIFFNEEMQPYVIHGKKMITNPIFSTAINDMVILLCLLFCNAW